MSHQGGHGGQLGHRPVRLITNAFEITQLPPGRYFQYDEFSPSLSGPKFRIKRQQLIQHLELSVASHLFTPQAPYDGESILYAPQRLNLANGGQGVFFVKLGVMGPANQNDRGTYAITLTLTTSEEIRASHVNDLIVNRDTRSNRALVATNLLQIIVRQGTNMHKTNNGRAYFTGQEKARLQGSGLELWRGVFLSVRPTIGKMVLNVDTCTAAVYQAGPLIDIAIQILGTRDVRSLALPDTAPQFKKLEKFFKGLQLKIRTATKRSRVKTIRGLISAAGYFEFFNDAANQQMTVAEHYQRVNNVPVQYPKIIGVRLTGKKNPHQDVVPLEFCEIEPGQLFRRKIPEELTTDMVKFSTINPQERLKKIVDAAKDTVNSTYVQDSGMVLRPSPLDVNAKLLNVPSVFFSPSANTPVDVRNGAWNVVRKRFTDPKPMRAWMVISFIQVHQPSGRYSEEYIGQRIVRELGQCCSNLGMEVEAKPYIVANANPFSPARVLTDSVSDYMRQCQVSTTEQQEKFLGQLILIILLPQNSAAIRAAVKYWGDVDKGIATQCLREQKLSGANDQYWNNIALKLNARLGGTNFHSVSPVIQQLKAAPYMIMGADVGHPGPGVQKPSVTGVVYSHDKFATQYVAITGIQSPRVELIENLRAYVSEAVDNFGKKNREALRRLIFYRDGLSEGEFDRVAATEIAEIKEAFQQVWDKRGVKSSLPQLTYIVVGKRHHAVFFPSRPDEGDKKGNSRAGSLIDSGITHPSGKDFYLQSHAAIQGTCRSSHYTVLHDENWNSSLTKIQELSYTLCHVYAKATRSVSIPAPVYYADLVCSRGQFHVDPTAPLQFGENDNASTASGSASLDLSNWQSAFRPVHSRLNKSMYFL